MKTLKTLTLAVFLLPALAFAQERKDIFANPENLKVLPEDISSADLGATMKGFAMGLGLRCEDCHVGEKGKPLTTFDFAADDKEMKLKARVMIDMVNQINNTLVPGLDKVEKAQRVDVRCITCHRGQRKPKLIQDVLDEELAENGIDAALARYAELRDKFHGSHSYDFSEFTLPMYAQGLSGDDKISNGIALAKVNAGHFPESYYTQFLLGELHNASGAKEEAINHYSKALELNPRAKPFLEPKIAALKGD
jgi:tetratricopeptide (TPR) repeat protein